MNNFLVTGGAGFIGSHICAALVKQGKKVICVDNLVTGKIDNIESLLNTGDLSFAYADVSKYNEIERLFKNIDIVLHQAASKCTVCTTVPNIDLRTNAWGTYNVLKAAVKHNCRKVIHASTGSIADIKSFYGVSKQAGESYLKAFHSYHNLCYTALRYHHIYGSQQNSKEGGGVVAIFIRQALNDEPCTIFGDGLQVRHFTHVKDAVTANLFAVMDSRTNGKILNVISRTTMTILDLAKMIHRLLNKEPKIVHLPPNPAEIRTFNAKGTELESMGFQFDNNFESGLTETIKWYKNSLTKEGK